MIVGPWVNGAAIVLGAVAGAALSHHIPARVREAMPLTLGLCSIAIGVVLMEKVAHLPVMALAILLGALTGELIYIEHVIGRASHAARGFIERHFPPSKGGLPPEQFIERFVVLVVLFCASGMGVFGSMYEGMTGDPTLLYTKALLDLCSASIFAATLGYAVAAIAVPQLVIQLALAFGATLIVPLVTPPMQNDFSAVGGVVMLATGLRICGIKLFPVANMLPALMYAMPLSALWAHFAH